MDKYYYNHDCISSGDWTAKMNVSMALLEATPSGVANNSSYLKKLKATGVAPS